MKYQIGNLLVLLLCASLMIAPVWVYLPIHWALKTLLSIVLLVIAGFFVERVLSKFVNSFLNKFAAGRGYRV